MFKFSPTLIYLDVLLFLLLLKGWYNVYAGHCHVSKNTNHYIYWYFIIVFILSVFGGLDWDYYNTEIQIVDFYKHGLTRHLETVYFLIADILPNYIVWRMFVWGLGILIMINTLKRLNTLDQFTCIFLTIFYIFSFYKLRGSLGIAILFWGFSFICCSAKYKRRCILGIMLMLISFFFHKSMVLTLAFMALLPIIPLKKSTLIISLISYPLLVTGISFFLIYFLSNQFNISNDELELAMKGGALYLSKEAAETTLVGKISNILSYGPIYLALFISFKYFFRAEKHTPPYIKYLLWFWYFATFFASLFIFIDASSWIYIRVLTMAYFPMCIVLGFIYRKTKPTLLMKIALVIATSSFIFNLFYNAYHSLQMAS